jgi:hypothetical protein
MDVESTATILLYRRDHLAAISSEHTDRRFIHIMKDLIHNATADKANTIALVADGGSDIRKPGRNDRAGR